MTRSAAASVKRYLEVLDDQSRRRASPMRLALLRQRLERIEHDIETTTDVIVRLRRYQEELDVRQALEAEDDFDQIEADFIAHVADWARANGVSHAALREAGVPAVVLRRAGVTP